MICAGDYILNYSDRMKCNTCPNLLVVGDGDFAPKSVGEPLRRKNAEVRPSERLVGTCPAAIDTAAETCLFRIVEWIIGGSHSQCRYPTVSMCHVVFQDRTGSEMESRLFLVLPVLSARTLLCSQVYSTHVYQHLRVNAQRRVSLVLLLMQAHSIMVDFAMTLPMSFRHAATSPVVPRTYLWLVVRLRQDRKRSLSGLEGVCEINRSLMHGYLRLCMSKTRRRERSAATCPLFEDVESRRMIKRPHTFM
jgi:hypothetical protein